MYTQFLIVLVEMKVLLYIFSGTQLKIYLRIHLII